MIGKKQPPSGTFDWDRRDYLRDNQCWTSGDILAEDRVLAAWGKYRIVYGPFDVPPTPKARIILLGLTPGFAQLKLANEVARDATATGTVDWSDIGSRIRERAAFAGPMRVNLVAMLDKLDVHRELGLNTCDELFLPDVQIARTTSALRYPVFINGDSNYHGDRAITTARPFKEMLDRILAPQTCRNAG